MITVLAVGGAAEELSPAFARHPSVEVLTARDGEDALEKLARNRRIDAVLLLAGPESADAARVIHEEDPGGPPLFAPASAGEVPHATSVADEPAAALVVSLARLLEHEA